MTESEKGLKAFIDCFHEGKGLQGIEKLIANIEKMIEKIDSLDEQPLFASHISKYLKSVIKKSEESPKE